MADSDTLVGVDGCRGGWIGVIDEGGRLNARVFADWSQLMTELHRATVIGVDIPIGLPAKGSRACDVEAHRRLGRPRGSSVFPAPVRGVFREVLRYREASDLHRQIDGRGLSQQAYQLLPKILQVDESLRADLDRQRRVFEIHPEVSFAQWNRGRPMAYRKSKSAGRLERERLIDAAWPGEHERLWEAVRREDCARDDLNDAFAALWTVRRVSGGEAATVASVAEFDEVGLRMDITV
jgi:predicted RNase H-like nuclease